jgi:hypothetical protein
VHWLIIVPIGLIVLASLMFVQHAQRERRAVAARAAIVAAAARRPHAAPVAAPSADAAGDGVQTIFDEQPAAASPGPVDGAALVEAPARPDATADARALAQFRQGLAELQRKRPKPALAIFEGIGAEPLRLAGRAMAQHDMRHAAESQLALEQLVRDHARDAPYRIAQAYAWRGQRDEAFLWLDRAVVQRDGGLADVKYDPALRDLRKDARYHALLARAGLPD